MWSLFLHSLFDIDTNILKDNDHLFNQGSNLNLQNFLDTTKVMRVPMKHPSILGGFEAMAL